MRGILRLSYGSFWSLCKIFGYFILEECLIKMVCRLFVFNRVSLICRVFDEGIEKLYFGVIIIVIYIKMCGFVF